ncbi:MAG: acyl-CoA dehydrogenase, partial [Frondihabitans sp.]|nr:acyl-CoA dehydrogenase [Frondihabitans sp.]
RTNGDDEPFGVTRPLFSVRGLATARPAPSLTSIHEAIRPILDRLREDARERDASRIGFPREIHELAQAGVALIRVHPENGGAGGSYRDLVEFIIEVARADSNVAQALRPTWLTADALARPVSTVELERLRERVLRGDLFSGTRNEVGVPSGAVTTTLTRREGGGFWLDGQKFYSTGGIYADWFSGSATTEEGEIVSVSVPTAREGVEMIDDYDGVGQRLTASGTTRLTRVAVSDDEVTRTALDAEPAFNPLAQLHLAATVAGIAQAVLDDAVRFAREIARPIKHSTATAAVDDPYVRRTVGEISSRALTARAVVLEAATALDAAVDRGREARVAATITVAEAQVAAVRATLDAAQHLFEVGSGSATLRVHGLDRHWRNARTVANHNPVDWKAAVVGEHRLTGAEPPSTGLF